MKCNQHFTSNYTPDYFKFLPETEEESWFIVNIFFNSKRRNTHALDLKNRAVLAALKDWVRSPKIVSSLVRALDNQVFSLRIRLKILPV